MNSRTPEKAAAETKKPGKAQPKRATYTIMETAELLGIGRNTAYEAARTGQIPTIRIGNRRLVPIAALEAKLNPPATA